jgi:RHS repeat-associated protein
VSSSGAVVLQGAASVQFVYDSEHARITMASTTGLSTVTKTYLDDPVTGAMSEVSSSGGTPTWTDYLMADGRLLGQRSCTGTMPCATGATTEYFVLDHLQSVSVVTDGATGSVTDRESFDAWGKQRNASGTDDPTCSTGPASPNKRRFTSQEHIDEMCLINLNARVYDPVIGRFMTADSMVPDPTDGQSYNRYTYTYTDNRPLSFTDPTGHEPDWDTDCLGSCSNPNMTTTTGFSIQETGMGDGTLKVTFSYNTYGELAAVTDKTGDGTVGVSRGVGLSGSNASPTANEFVLKSDACSNTQPPGTEQPSDNGQIETVVVTAERKPSVVNGYQVIIIDTKMPGPGEIQLALRRVRGISDNLDQ